MFSQRRNYFRRSIIINVYFVTALKHLKCIDKMYSHNGSMVLCNDKVVCISNETGSEVSSHFPHSISLIDVRTCDMKLFVTRSQDNILRVWDITREDVQNKLPQQNNNIRSQSYCNLISVSISLLTSAGVAFVF